jgi:hypothetical protein
MRKPNLSEREAQNYNAYLTELGLEIKGSKKLTKQNLSKPVKSLDANS